MTTPIPALNPIKTGSEMKLAIKPIRKSDARTRKPPTSNVNSTFTGDMVVLPNTGGGGPSENLYMRLEGTVPEPGSATAVARSTATSSSWE